MKFRSMGYLYRRLLVTALTLTFLGSPAFGEVKLRAMTANLTSGNFQNYDEGHGVRIIKALKPDVVMIQEFNFGDNSKQDIRKLVDSMLGSDYQFHRESPSDAQIPNGIITRYPIKDSGVWRDPYIGNRGFAWACIELPDGKYLWAYSVHFSAGNYEKRVGEAQELVRLIKSQVDPESDMVLIGGDFNTKSRGEKALKILADLVGDESTPVGPDGRAGTNRSRTKPYDWVMANDALDRHAIAVDIRADQKEKGVIGKNVFPGGLVVDSRAFHPNPFAGLINPKDSEAKNMQHMGVVKEFAIP